MTRAHTGGQQTNTQAGDIHALREPLKMKKISGNETRRQYVRHYTGLPAALVGNAMNKEYFLNDLTTKTLDILGVHRRRRKLVTIQ